MQHEIKVLPILLILVNFFSASNALRLPPQQPFAPNPPDNYCSGTCPSNEGSEQPTLIKYKENEIYRYRLEGLTSIHTFNTLKEENTKLTYSATFDIASENRCAFLLRVSNVEVVGLDGKKYPDNSLIGSVARFSFNNGRLEKLCLDEKESEISANFKRSILSNLQISTWANPITGPGGTSSHETDVYGRCPVSLDTTQEPNGSWIVKKSKDINQCKLRQGFDFAIKTDSFQPDGSHQTNPFVDASLRSVLKVDKGIIRTCEVNEEYTYQPMTKYGDSQTSVVVTTKIVLIGTKSGSLPAPTNSKPASLLYETVKSYRNDATVATLIKAIQEASQENEADVVPSNAAKTFSHFVSVLQEVNKNELLIAHDQVKSGAGFKHQETAMKVFWGGLLSAGTPATTEAAATLLMNREMPQDKIPEFMASLGFVKHPTSETLNTLSPLLDGPNVAVDRYLAIGSLIQRYTADNPNVEPPELTNLLAKLSNPLRRRSVPQTIEEQDLVIASFKGLRNARYLSAEVSSLVRNYATNKDLPNRVRIAALQALAVNSSEEATKKTALALFQSLEEDAELRISAFLVYVDTPTAETAITLKNLLDEEKSDQVGNFIITWIRNLKTTADPKREHLKHFYGNIKSKNKYPGDLRKYSQNLHFSQLFPSLNSGYSVDANLIYSSQSYIPRTTSLNLDTNIFGNSINLLGLNARLENVDYLAEKIFGPRSYLRTNKAEVIADDLSEMAHNLARQMGSKASLLGRGKREVHNIEETVSQLKQKISSSDKFMDLDFSINMFESEIFWSARHTDKNVVASGEYLDHLFRRIQQAIEDAEDIDVNYKKYARIPILSNNVIHYPTSSGFTLTVTIHAHSAVNFKLKGKVDTTEILNNPKSADVQLLVMPSAVIDIEGLLEIDANVISAGLKISSTLRSATSLKINFKMLDGSGVDLRLGLPTMEEDLLSIKTEAFTTMRERGLPSVEVPLNSNGKKYQYGNTFAQLAELTGLALQVEMNLPFSGIRPTIGTGVFSVRFVKIDELLQDYQLRFFYNKNLPGYRSVEFLLDTPGSRINRKIMFFADANSREKKASAKFVTAKKELSLEAFGQNENNEVYCLLTLRNEGYEYTAKVGATVTKEKFRTTFKPFLDLKSLDERESTLEKHRLTPKDTSKPFTIDGVIVLDRKKDSDSYRLYDFQKLTFTSPFGKYELNGRMLLDSEYPRYGSDLVLKYGNENTISFKSTLNYTKNLPEDTRLLAAISLLSSQWPAYNFKGTLNYSETPIAYARTITLASGPDVENENSKFTVREVLNKAPNPATGEILSADGSLQVTYPAWKTDINLAFQQANRNFFSGSGHMQLDKTKLVLNGSASVGKTKPGTIEVILDTQMNEKQLHLNGVRELVDEETSKITVDVNTNPGKQLHIVMDLTHRVRPHNFVLRSNSIVTVLPDNRLYMQDIGLVYSPTQKNFHIIFSPKNVKNLELSAGYSTGPSGFESKAVLFVLNSLDGSATLKAGSEKVDGDLRLEISKLNRLITGDLALQVHDGTHYIGHGELMWDASKDRNKKIRIETNTLISEDKRDIVTENDIQMMNYRFQINGNISIEGELLNSTIDSHIQLVVSNGSSMGVVVHREYHAQEAVHNYNLHLEGYYVPVEKHEDVEATFTLNLSDFDWTAYLFDLKTDWTLDLPRSRSLKQGIEVKRVMHSNQWIVGASLYADGTMVIKPLNLSGQIEYSDLVNEYGLLSKERSLPPSTLHLHANFGSDYLFDTAATIHNSEIDNVLEMRVPLQNKLLDVKLTTKNKVDVAAGKYVNLRTTNHAAWSGGNYANWDGELAVYSKNGKFALEWDSTRIAKRSMEVFYEFDDTQKGNLTGPYGRGGVELKFDGKVANCVGKLEFSPDLSTKVLTIEGQSPKNGSFQIRAETRVEDFGQSVLQDLLFELNGKRWYASSKIATYPTKPMVELLYASPEAESKFMIAFEERIRNYWTGAINVSLMHGVAGYVKLVGELKLDSKDDILIKADLDAPSFGVNNFSLVANNKAIEGGKKRITFTSQMDGRDFFSGSTSYIYHVDNNKLTFEGSGTVLLDNKNRQFTFKYFKVQLLESTSGETGSASKLYVSVDNKKYALDMECKFTDKSVMLKRYLWRGEDVYKMDISYQIKMTDVTHYEKNLLIHFDLKPHIPNGELFIIEGKTTKSLSSYDQKMSLQWAPGKKVEYIINSVPGKSGIIINLPKRQLAGEAVYIYNLGATNGKVEITNCIWFDKTNDETKKLLFSSDVEYRIPENQHSFILRSSADLHIPTLPKTLSANTTLILSLLEQKSIEVQTELDVFKTQEQMVTISYELFKGRKDNGYKVWSSLKAVSPGQRMNTEIKRCVTFYLDHMEYDLLISYDNAQGIRKIAALKLEFRPLAMAGKISFDNFTLEGKSEIGITRNSLELKEEFIVFGHEYKKTVILTLEPSIIVMMQWEGATQQAVLLNMSLEWNRAVDVVLNLQDKKDVTKSKGHIVKLKLHLTDKKFLSTDTDFQIDRARIFMDDGKQEVLSLIEDARKRSKSALSELGTQYAHQSKQFRNANLDMKPVIESSNAYLAALREEIKSDPSIVSASQNVRKITTGIIDFVFFMLEQMSSSVGDWVYGYDIVTERLGEFMDELAALINKISQLSIDDITLFIRESVNQLWRLTLQFIEYAKANKTKWREAIVSVSDSVKDTFKVTSETFAQVKKDAQEFCERLKAYLETLPLTNYLKDRFAQLKDSRVIQYMWSAVREAGQNLKEYVSNEEFKTLISMILSTLDKIIEEKPYNLEEEIRAIYKQLMECFSVLAVKASDGLTYVRDVTDSYEYSLPQLSLSSFKALPNLWASSVSYINWLREIDLPSANDVMETFDVESLNSLELLPPFKKVGVIINGQQVVTMNGLHYSINADCQYLLAADFQNMNFTLMATIRDGKMSSLVVTSDQQTIELHSNGMPALNKNRQDFPIYAGRLSAIRNPTSTEIYVDNSVYIHATLSLDIVVIQISGFYYGQVFGLLGSTTSESYLDLAMPNMSIAKDLPTFVRSYQMSKKCRASAPQANTDLPKSSECASMFSGKSIVRRSYSQMKANAFREVCEEMVARESTPAEKLNAACKTVLAFSLMSYTRGYYISLPTQCSHCTMNGKSLPYGYSDTVIAPVDSAYIFILLDRSEGNKILYQELLLHAMKNIRSSLEKQNIRDLKFVLMGYTEDQYASLHTTNGEVTLTENTNVEFSTSIPREPSSELGKYVRNVKYFLGFYEARRALDMVNNYPFQPEAVNSIIQVDANTVDYTALDKYSIYNTLVNTYVSWNIVNNKVPVFLLTSRKSVSGDLDNSSTVVFGFDMNNILTVNGPQPFKDGILNRLKLLEMFGGSVVLPVSTNGALFNSSVFVNSDATARSKLTDVFSNRLVQSLTNIERSVECVCKNKWDSYSNLKCSLIRESIKS